MKLLIGSMLITVVLSACSSTMQITKLKESECNGNHPAPSIFLNDEKPAKAFENIALLTVDNHKSRGITEPEMFEELKKNAANLCADGLIIQEIRNDTVYMEKMVTIRAIAIRYKQ